MTIDTSAWSGEGEFTALLVEALKGMAGIAWLKVEDAPASRAETGYNFLSNEIYVRFAGHAGSRLAHMLAAFSPFSRGRAKKMTLADLARALEAMPGIGGADYEDEGILQFLRTDRIVPPYQTHGTKLVELVRVYEVRPAA